MRSARANTASMSCSISRIVSAPFSWRSNATMRADSSDPMPAIGSSSSSTCGAVAEADASTIWLDRTGKLADQRGLAGAVRTDDGVQFAGPHRERDVVGGGHATEALAQALDGKDRLSHGGPRAAR